MARILYGVQGKGRGNSSRSRIIIGNLVAHSHQVKILTSHRGHDYLSRYFPDVIRIMGLGFVFDGDRPHFMGTRGVGGAEGPIIVYATTSEALHLGKPIYSIPIAGQFEQMINGYYLEKLGYGLFDLCPTEERLAVFLDGLDYCRRDIQRDTERFYGNPLPLDELEAKIAEPT